MKKEPVKVNLNNIKDPTFLKTLTYQELDLLSNDIKDYILDVTSKKGGHLSSNLGVIDSTIALCRVFDFSKDKIIFDVGHQCYTYKILTGRNLDNLRQKDGVSGFQKMNESPYDHFECGHSSTSISAANGMAIARDLKNEHYDIISFIGDASIVNGLAFEGLNNATEGRHKIIIVLNDNGMAISKPSGGTARLFRKFSTTKFYLRNKNRLINSLRKCRPGRAILRMLISFKNWFKRKVLSLNMFDLLGYKMIGPVDGHDIKELEKAFNKAKAMTQSVVVYMKTKKGKGYSFAENDDDGLWHGVSKFDKESGEQVHNDASATWSNQYEVLLKNEMAINDKIVTIVPGTAVGSSLPPLFKIYPDRMIDVGIAEEHALTMASGLALSGFHPVISIYSTFLQRGYDQLSHDLARMNCNATLLIDRSGLVGNDGETHQGIYDEQFLLGIPNVTVTMASRSSEAISLFKESFCNHGVFAIRYPREHLVNDTSEVKKIPYGSWKEELHGQNIAIVSLGPVTIELKERLEKEHHNVTLLNALYQKPMDENKIHQLLAYQKIIIYDAYGIRNGFSESLSARLLELGYQGKVIIKAIPDIFVKQASIKEQRIEFAITVDDVLNELK